jgi:4-amino-4-deoxy-L-arabinose transferase-like glycosyltransferase
MKSRGDLVHISLILALLALSSSLLILAAVPPVSRDALIHHLAIAKLYLEHGGMYEIPELVYSYYPAYLQMLYWGALALGSDILPKYIHMVFGFATAYLIYHHLRSRLNSAYGLLGALFFLSIPIIVKLSITVYVDLGLCFFSTAALLLILKWTESGHPVKYVIWAGLCAGMALGIKYNGLLVVCITGVLIPIIYLRTAAPHRFGSAQAIKYGAFFILFAVIAASPWLIRNSVWTANPVYPLYDWVFNPDQQITNDPHDETSSIRGVFATRYVLYNENVWQLAALPLRIFWQGKDDDPRYFDGRLSPFLLILPMVSLASLKSCSKTNRHEQLILLSFCLLYFVFAFNSTALRVRYLVPMVPPLVLLTMHGAARCMDAMRPYVQKQLVRTGIALGAAVLLVLPNILYLAEQFKIVQPFAFISRAISRDDYITRFRPEHPVIVHTNMQLPADAHILAINLGNRGYYFDRAVQFESTAAPRFLLAWLTETGANAASIKNHVVTSQISHILVRRDLFVSWLEEQPAEIRTLWNEFFQSHLLFIMSHDEYGLFEIKTAL